MVHRMYRSILFLLSIMDSRNPLPNPDQVCTYSCWIDCSTRADELRSQLHGFVIIGPASHEPVGQEG